MNDKIIQYTNDLDKLSNNSRDSRNDKIIFQYVAKKVDNISNYSYIQKDVKNVSDSINSSEIFNEDKHNTKNEMNSRDRLQIENTQKSEIKNNKENKKPKEKYK